MIRKVATVGSGGRGRPVEGGHLLLAEETGGRQWSVEVLRMFAGNLIPVNCLLLLLSVVGPLVSDLLGIKL